MTIASHIQIWTRYRTATLALLLSVIAWLPAVRGRAQPPGVPPSAPVIQPTTATRLRTVTGPNRVPSHQDVLLLLNGGPLHLRVNITLGSQSLEQYRQAYVDRLMTGLDADHDGRVTRQEATASPLFRTRQRPGASEFVQSLRTRAPLTRREVEQTVHRFGGELIAYRQDLSSSRNDIEVFKLLDQNESGVLEDDELAAAADLILSRDRDGDECVAFAEFLPLPPVDERPLLAQPISTPVATIADIVRDLQEPLLPNRLLKKYDRQRDGELEVAELNWTSGRLALSDTNGNGKLDVDELRHLSHDPPDVELSVDLQAEPHSSGLLRVIHTVGTQLDDHSRSDFAKVGFSTVMATFSLRNLDPVNASLLNAIEQFNQLDIDANGYLEREETSERIRFERGLFDLIDADGDGKLFADEMKHYVHARSEPAATGCRMNVYDTGNGFFMALDANADGKVSVRETRSAVDALRALERDGQPGLTATEPVRHFHVEFVRGGYQLFGPSEQLITMTPAFQRRPLTGPVWFQRMDRNNDGDLTWNEFLGPREVFHRLDRDRDSLIDPQEAKLAQ